MEMCKENCDTCIEDKSCCNGVYRTLDKDGILLRLLFALELASLSCEGLYDYIEDIDL